jgi:ferredoxin
MSGGVKRREEKMAMQILEECIACDACKPDCPTQAIAEGNPYVIDPEKCNECADTGGNPQCVEVCPVDCIIKKE